MLHGYVVIIKRTGEDGSKYPVTEREVKIGTSAGCHIIINTPFVATEHCALRVRNDGQVCKILGWPIVSLLSRLSRYV